MDRCDDIYARDNVRITPKFGLLAGGKVGRPGSELWIVASLQTTLHPTCSMFAVPQHRIRSIPAGTHWPDRTPGLPLQISIPLHFCMHFLRQHRVEKAHRDLKIDSRVDSSLSSQSFSDPAIS